LVRANGRENWSTTFILLWKHVNNKTEFPFIIRQNRGSMREVPVLWYELDFKTVQLGYT
jgi:hypothetical protein